MANVIDVAVAWAVATAQDNSHGYDQGKRWGPDYDCSSFVITAFEKAGIKLKKAGASTTRDMIKAMLKCGFTEVTSAVNLRSGSGLQKGDVLWRTGHVAMMAKSNYIVQASINEKGTITGGKTGDQTGKEIYVKKWSTPTKAWERCFRYSTPGEATTDGLASHDDVISSNAYLSAAEMLTNAQYILNYLCGKGWSKEAVCGILGNMQVESTINPGIWEGLDEGNTSKGFGLVQWTPASTLINWATQNNLDYKDIDTQLYRLIWELETNTQYIPTQEYPGSFAQFVVSTASPGTLALAFMYNYERPGSYSTGDKRAEYALAWYNLLTVGENVGQGEENEAGSDGGRKGLSKLLFYFVATED